MASYTEISNSDNVIDSRDVIKRIEELTEWKDAAVERLAEIRARLEEIRLERLDIENDEAADTALDEEADKLTGEIWEADDKGEAIEYGETPDWTEAEHEELKALLSLQEEASGAADWSYGETLIADSYFEEYAEQLAQDIGLVSDTDKWPMTCINWEEAAEELKQDYTSVDFDGETYWIRA